MSSNVEVSLIQSTSSKTFINFLAKTDPGSFSYVQTLAVKN